MKKLALILAIMLIASCLSCALTGVAFAASETIYTGVLEDLSKDETFDQSNYPAKAKLSKDDRVMNVFQIAESNAGELFLYVYQPLENKITVTEARISTTIGDNLAPKDYKLTLLERDGTLEKYKVDELQVKSDVERYYFIIQLSRPWNAQIDNGNVVDSIAYGVEKLFTAVNSDNGVNYSEEHSDCLEIVGKYVGNLRYYDGGEWGSKDYYTSVHYVAFSTEILIDEIYEVDLKYEVSNYKLVDEYAYNHWADSNQTFFLDRDNPPVTKQKTLTSIQYASYKNPWDYLFNKTHTWNTIQSKDTFVSSENLDSSVKEKLDSMQWVLRFDTTNITRVQLSILGGTTYKFSEVSEVTLLRLNFLSKGKAYNLGVIDNKQTGGSVTEPDNPADNPENPLEGFKALLKEMQELWTKIIYGFNWLVEHWWYIIIGFIAIGIVVGIIIAFFKFGFKLVMRFIGMLLWFAIKWIVLLPFTLLYYGIKNAKERKG